MLVKINATLSYSIFYDFLKTPLLSFKTTTLLFQSPAPLPKPNPDWRRGGNRTRDSLVGSVQIPPMAVSLLKSRHVIDLNESINRARKNFRLFSISARVFASAVVIPNGVNSAVSSSLP
jgi:hypothetical protein